MNILVELNRTGPSGRTLDVKFLPEFQQLRDYDLEEDDPDSDDYDEPRQKGRASRDEMTSESSFSDEDDDIIVASERRSSSSEDDDDEPRTNRSQRPRRTRDDDDDGGY
jgi:hypothetical protein